MAYEKGETPRDVLHGFNLGCKVEIFPLHGYFKYLPIKSYDTKNEVLNWGHKSCEDRA